MELPILNISYYTGNHMYMCLCVGECVYVCVGLCQSFRLVHFSLEPHGEIVCPIGAEFFNPKRDILKTCAA